MKMTCWINKGLKGEKCFVEEFDNKHDLLAPIYGVDKKELIHALEYLDVLVSDSKSRKITELWYDLNRELYDDGFKILVVAFEYE